MLESCDNRVGGRADALIAFHSRPQEYPEHPDLRPDHHQFVPGGVCPDGAPSQDCQDSVGCWPSGGTASLPCPLLAWALVAPIVLGFFDNGKFMLIFFFWVRSQNFRIIHPIGFSKDQNRTMLYITKSYSQLCDRTKRRGAVSWPSLGPDSQVTYSCKANHSPGTWRTRHPPNNVTGRAAPPRQPASIRTRSTARAIS